MLLFGGMGENDFIPEYNMFIANRASDRPKEDVLLYDNHLWGVTINICPNKCINHKRWRMYDQDQQVKILLRLEGAFRKKTLDLQLKELNFESCPSSGNMHFHAMYYAPKRILTCLESYWTNLIDNTEGWRTYDCQEVYNEEGWTNYIHKSQ